MILISQNITNYDIPIPENAVFRINLSWINSTAQLIKLLELHKSRKIFLDLPINRTKPPNNRYSLDDIISILKNHNNIEYIAISNVESAVDLDEYIELVPKNITIVPKIESHTGVENIKSIIKSLNIVFDGKLCNIKAHPNNYLTKVEPRIARTVYSKSISFNFLSYFK